MLARLPDLGGAGVRQPEDSGLNVEGVAWDPGAGALLFGLRGPVSPGHVRVVVVPVDAGGARWTTACLGEPAMVSIGTPRPSAAQGIRDLSYGPRAGEFLRVLGRSAGRGDEPFRLCRWRPGEDTVRPFDVTFHRSAKPEGVTAFSTDGKRKILVVDDAGGYAIL
ncbi:DUF3616 domain-containing protein [Amycolatopsis sp. NPDC051903]|uniref:DUF3616 domain-containing protein n=1 Tax=Amycolatopsis sp. NPDC051903 TaxID=3363936 RepID=UPI00379E2484